MQKMRKTLKLGIVALLVVAAFFALGINALADTPDVTVNENVDFENEEITGLSQSWEYSTDKKTWKDVWDETLDISGLISSSNVLVYFRDEADGLDATYATLAIPSRKNTPSGPVKYSGLAEKIAVTAGNGTYQYKTGLFGWTDINDLGTSYASVSTSISVRKAAVATSDSGDSTITGQFATTPITITVPLRAAAPKATYDVTTDSIKGLTSAMELGYTEDGATPDPDSYINVPSGKTTLTRADLVALLPDDFSPGTDAGYFHVRVKATETAPASQVAVVPVPASYAEDVTVGTNGDTAIVDYDKETLTPSANAPVLEYSKDGGKTYAAIPTTGLSLTPIIPANGKTELTLLIRAKATAETPASAAAELALPPRPATPTSKNIYFDAVEEKFAGDSLADLVYIIGSGTEYTATAGDINSNTPSVEVGTAAVSVKFKVPSSVETNAESFASLPFTVTVPKRPAAPTTPAYDATTDSVKGLSTGYQIAVKPTDPDAPEYKPVAKTVLTRDEIEVAYGVDEDAGATLLVRVKASGSTPASAALEVKIPAGPDDSFVAEDSVRISYTTEKLTPNTDTPVLEYSKDSGKTYAALPSTGLSLTSIIPAAGKPDLTLSIRTKAIAGANPKPASAPDTIVIPARPATPTKSDVSYDFTEEKFVDVDADLVYQIGSTAYAPVGTGGAMLLADDNAKISDTAAVAVKFKFPAAEPTAAYTEENEDDEDGDPVSVPAVEGKFVSAEYTVTLPKRPAAPTAPKYAVATDTITGVSTALEWFTGNNAPADGTVSTWNLFTGTSVDRAGIYGSGDEKADARATGGTVYIRTKATALAPASKFTSAVNFPSITNHDAPAVTVDFATETIVNSDNSALGDVASTLEYAKYANPEDTELPAKPTWTAVPKNGALTTLIPAAGKANLKIAIRTKATKELPASGATPITIPARPAAPTKNEVLFNAKDAKITTAENVVGLEYFTGDAAYATFTSPVTVTPASATQTYKFRVAKTESSFVSLVYTLTVPAIPKAPTSPTYTVSSDSITGVSTAMEWATTAEPASWTPVEGTVIDRSKFNTNAAIYVRTAATATAFASAVKTVDNIPDTTDTPSVAASNIDYGTETLGSVSAAMEYQKAGASSWTKITGDTLNIASLIPAAGKDPQVINVRVKAADGNPASAAVTINIPARPATPKAADVVYDYSAEKFSTVPSGSEYVLGKATAASEYADLTTSAAIPATTSSQIVSIRIKQTNASFASLPMTVTIAARPAAPSAVKWDPKKLAVTGFTTLMQYQITPSETPDDSNWGDATAGLTLAQGVDIHNSTANVYVHARLKATATKPTSSVRTVMVQAITPTS